MILFREFYYRINGCRGTEDGSSCRVRNARFAAIVHEDWPTWKVVSIVHPVAVEEGAGVGFVEVVKGEGDACCDGTGGGCLLAEKEAGGAECWPDLGEEVDEEW